MSDNISKPLIEIQTVDCPVCGPAQSVIWMEDGKSTRYIRCKECGTIYASPRSSWKTRYAWLDNSFSYGEKAIRNSISRHDGMNQEEAILKSKVKSGRMLDIGCDLGNFYQWFKNPEWDCYGSEISPTAAKYASDTYHAKVFPGTIHQASFPDHIFDLITIFDTFYYVDEPKKDLIEIGRIIKPGGILAIEIPGQKYQILRSKGIVCWLIDRKWTRWQTDSSYLSWFTASGLRKLLEDNGFQLLNIHIIRSPKTSNLVTNAISGIYFNLFSKLFNQSLSWLDWAPKFLYITQYR